MTCHPEPDEKKPPLYYVVGQDEGCPVEDPSLFSTRVEFQSNTDDESFFDILQSSNNDVRALLDQEQLPDFLERVVDLHPRLTAAFVESVRTGHLCLPETNLCVHLQRLRDGTGMLLRVWSRDGTICFSMEPTATEGRWLVFAWF